MNKGGKKGNKGRQTDAGRKIDTVIALAVKTVSG